MMFIEVATLRKVDMIDKTTTLESDDSIRPYES